MTQNPHDLDTSFMAMLPSRRFAIGAAFVLAPVAVVMLAAWIVSLIAIFNPSIIRSIAGAF